MGKAPSTSWPKACVFDCDGLLVASTHAWDAAYLAVTEAAGARPEDLDLERLLGASVSTAAAELTAQLGRSVDEPLLRQSLDTTMRQHQPAAMPGARRLLKAIEDRRIPMAVASNGPTEVVHRALHHTRLMSHFTAVVTADDVPRPKPAPDVYLCACRELGIDPSDALGLEDSLTGARSASAAGLVVVGVGIMGATRGTVDLAVPSLDDRRLLTFLEPKTWRTERLA